MSWGGLVNQSASSCETAPSFIPSSSTPLLSPAQANSLLTGLTALVSPSPTQPALCRQVNLPQTPLSRCSWLENLQNPACPTASPMNPTPCPPLAGTSGPCTHPTALDPLPGMLSLLLQTTHSNPLCPAYFLHEVTLCPLRHLFLQSSTEVRATSCLPSPTFG